MPNYNSNEPRVVKKEINEQEILDFFAYKKLNNKTQMIRNNSKLSGIYSFTNRKIHTDLVEKVAEHIHITKFRNVKDIDSNRLKFSAMLHDVGHTPFGHACEEEINDQFLSNDKLHYSSSNPGLFKHNINSVKLISEYFQVEDDDYILVDSILKHSTTFPKNYNYRLFSSVNILKCSYIFSKIKFNESQLLDSFIDCYISKCRYCQSRSDAPAECSSNNNNICYSCKKKNRCFFKYENRLKRENLSLYLAYPYPLTVEGTILYWADEISGFCRDILDFCCFVKLHKRNDVGPVVALSSIQSKLYLLKARFGDNKFLAKVETLFKNIDSNYQNDSCFVNEYKCETIELSGESLLVILVNSLENKYISDNSVDIRFNGDECLPLFSLDPRTKEIFLALKSSIYADIHNMKYIKKSNEAGKKVVDFIINYFLKHFNYFIKAYKNYSQHTKEDICLMFARSTMAMLDFKNISKKARKPFVELFKKWPIQIVDEDSLQKIDLISKYAKDDKKTLKLILNLFKREIGYFVATLSEDEIFKLLNEIKNSNESAKEVDELIKAFPNNYSCE